MRGLVSYPLLFLLPTTACPTHRIKPISYSPSIDHLHVQSPSESLVRRSELEQSGTSSYSPAPQHLTLTPSSTSPTLTTSSAHAPDVVASSSKPRLRAYAVYPRTTVVLEPRTNTHAHLAPLPEADEANVEVWRITPNEMAFENIGLTHDVPSPGAGTDGPARKLLACAECDLGPLGWHVVGTSEFWLVADRVGYRVAA